MTLSWRFTLLFNVINLILAHEKDYHSFHHTLHSTVSVNGILWSESTLQKRCWMETTTLEWMEGSHACTGIYKRMLFSQHLIRQLRISISCWPAWEGKTWERFISMMCSWQPLTDIKQRAVAPDQTKWPLTDLKMCNDSQSSELFLNLSTSCY